MEEKHCCATIKPWYKQPLFLVVGVIVAFFLLDLLLLENGIGVLSPVAEKFFQYLSKTWWAIALGLVIGGIIEVLVPQELIVKLLSNGKKSIFIAAVMGFLASACSHGILAIALSLYKKGASTTSTLVFLLAAPWANLAITLLLFSLFGVKALYIVFGALAIAVISGFVFLFLEDRGIIEGKKENGEFIDNGKIRWIFPGLGKTVVGVVNSIQSLSKSVVWWVLLGFFLASLLGAYLPESLMQTYFGANLVGTVLTLVLASIIEVCSEGSAPMAFELYDKTKAFGNAFVFLQAGVATDFTEIGFIATNIGKKAAMAMVLVGVPQIVAFGYLLNLLV